MNEEKNEKIVDKMFMENDYYDLVLFQTIVVCCCKVLYSWTWSFISKIGYELNSNSWLNYFLRSVISIYFNKYSTETIKFKKKLKLRNLCWESEEINRNNILWSLYLIQKTQFFKARVNFQVSLFKFDQTFIEMTFVRFLL